MSQPDRAIEELTAQLKSARVALTLTVARAEQAETTASNALDEIRRLTAALGTLIQERNEAREERDAAIADTHDYMEMAQRLKQAERERDEALGLHHQKGCPQLGVGAAVERRCTCGTNLLRAEIKGLQERIAALARADALVRNIVESYDRYRQRGAIPAPEAYTDMVQAINHAAAYLRDREGGAA